MAFSDDLRKNANEFKEGLFSSELEEDVNVFIKELRDKCIKASKNGLMQYSCSFGVAYVPIKYRQTEAPPLRQKSDFVTKEEAERYQIAVEQQLSPMGFSSFRTSIEKLPIHKGGLLHNGVGYFAKQMFARDYKLDVHVSW